LPINANLFVTLFMVLGIHSPMLWKMLLAFLAIVQRERRRGGVTRAGKRNTPDHGFARSTRIQDPARARDRLCQWCHGAPGMAMVFAMACDTFGEERY
jgi:hypothetical protein